VERALIISFLLWCFYKPTFSLYDVYRNDFLVLYIYIYIYMFIRICYFVWCLWCLIYFSASFICYCAVRMIDRCLICYLDILLRYSGTGRPVHKKIIKKVKIKIIIGLLLLVGSQPPSYFFLAHGSRARNISSWRMRYVQEFYLPKLPGRHGTSGADRVMASLSFKKKKKKKWKKKFSPLILANKFF
jgi:hypothetical protein